MMRYCDYDYYVNEYQGTMSEEDFNREVLKASAYINQITLGRINEITLAKYSEEIKLATCAACDCIYVDSTGGEVTSESVGSWSRSYGGSGKTSQQKLYDSAETYLLMTGLLYRGAML